MVIVATDILRIEKNRQCQYHLYYFDKNKIDYMAIGNMKEDAFNSLIEFIENLEIPNIEVIDNLN